MTHGVGQGYQGINVSLNALNRCYCFLCELIRAPLGGCQPMDGYIGHFLPLPIRMGGFAQFFD